MSTFHIQNFGCRANQADGAALEAQLEAAGLARAAGGAGDADWVVLNTCTVTAAADAEARAAIRRLHRERPRAKIVVTGCYAQRAPQALVELAGVTAVVGNTHKAVLGQLLAAGGGWEGRQHQLPKIVTGDIFEQTQVLVAPSFGAGEKTRPTLKVQDGCGNRCSYCVIPWVRGDSRSLPLGQTLEQVSGLVAAGYREVVISGINLGQWGRDLDEKLRLPDLVRAILDQTTLGRLRLSSVEPMDWTPELIALLGHPRMARHAHLPLQSGSDAVLRRMHRRYRPWHYAERAQALRAHLPEAAIGADVMVGFPGETAAEFEETRALVAELPFTYLHVFTFSSREGTAAAQQLDAGGWDPVAPAVAAERSRILRDLITQKRQAFLAGLVGRTLPAITLPGGWALSDNFIKVRLASPGAPNQLVQLAIAGAAPDHLIGTVAA